MKKFIIITLVIAMVFVNCGFASPRAFDYSEIIEELEDEGFTKRGDVYTYEQYADEDNLEWIVAWYDLVDNYGVATVYGYSDEYSKRLSIAGCYSITWDCEESEFVITDVVEIRR